MEHNQADNKDKELVIVSTWNLRASLNFLGYVLSSILY